MSACLYILHILAVQLLSLCVLFVPHVSSALSTLDWRYNCHCPLLRRCKSYCLHIYTLRHSSIYFLCKTKMADGCFVDFATHSLAVAYLHVLIPLGHSMVDAPGAWEVLQRFSNGGMRRSQTLVWSLLNYYRFKHSLITVKRATLATTYMYTYVYIM